MYNMGQFLLIYKPVFINLEIVDLEEDTNTGFILAHCKKASRTILYVFIQFHSISAKIQYQMLKQITAIPNHNELNRIEIVNTYNLVIVSTRPRPRTR